MTSQITEQTWVAPEVEALLARLGPTGRVPDHTDLPDSDGEIVENFNEYPQTQLLNEGIRPLLDRLHPDKLYMLGGNNGVYYDLQAALDGEPLKGVLAPDWFYVPGVPQMRGGAMRRSYVLWKEWVRPLIVIEYVSDDEGREYDRTPRRGKFWIYEAAIQATYYVIYDGFRGVFEAYRRGEHGAYEPLPPDDRGLVMIEPLGVALGLWNGEFFNTTCAWLRWYAPDGTLLPTDEERAEAERQRAEAEHRRAEAEHRRAEAERQRAEAERQRAEAERQRAEKLASQLRALGIDPDA